MLNEKINFNNSEPLFMQLVNIFENKIIQKEIVTGDKIPSERELCKMFQVNARTIGKALDKLVEDGYLVRRPSLGTIVISSEPKKGIDLKRKNEIGLVICPSDENLLLDGYSNPRIHDIIKGVEEKIKERGLYLLYGSVSDNELSLNGKERDIAGLIVTGEGGINPKYFRIIKKTGLPFVLIGDLAQKTKTNETVDIIANNDFQSVYMLTKHLTDLGHKKIAYVDISFEKNSWEIEQFNGYKQALTEAGFTYEGNLLIQTEKYTLEDAYISMKKFLEKTVLFTAMVCIGEVLCCGAMKAVREKGLRIPEDIGVVCNGESPELTLSTHDNIEMGRVAVERLMKRITEPNIKPERIIVPDKLIVRDSVRKLKEFTFTR